MTMHVCGFCKMHCADADDLADHQWREHPTAVCACGHVEVEHAPGGGACERDKCLCAAFSLGGLAPPRVEPLTVAALQARLDEIGGTLHVACVSHVWSVVLSVDGAQVRAQHGDLLDALRRVVVRLDEVRGG